MNVQTNPVTATPISKDKPVKPATATTPKIAKKPKVKSLKKTPAPKAAAKLKEKKKKLKATKPKPAKSGPKTKVKEATDHIAKKSKKILDGKSPRIKVKNPSAKPYGRPAQFTGAGNRRATRPISIETKNAEFRRDIIAILKRGGSAGVHVNTIAEKTGRTVNGVYVFFSTTAKHFPEIKKIAPATFTYDGSEAIIDKVAEIKPAPKPAKKKAAKKK